MAPALQSGVAHEVEVINRGTFGAGFTLRPFEAVQLSAAQGQRLRDPIGG